MKGERQNLTLLYIAQYSLVISFDRSISISCSDFNVCTYISLLSFLMDCARGLLFCRALREFTVFLSFYS